MNITRYGLRLWIAVICLAALPGFAGQSGAAQAKPGQPLPEILNSAALPKSAVLEIPRLNEKISGLGQKLAQAAPGSAQALEIETALGILCVLARDYEAGLGHLNRAAGSGLESYAAYYSGLALFKKGDIEAAARQFAKPALEPGALKQDAIFFLGLGREAAGDASGALGQYKTWLAAGDVALRGTVLLRAAGCAVNLGDYAQAGSLLRELCLEYPQSTSADKGEVLARELYAQGKIAFAPDSTPNLFTKAQLLVDKNSGAKAQPILERLNQSSNPPERARALYLLGKLSYAKRQNADAIRLFSEAASLDPGGEVAAFAKLHEARCLWRSDAPEDAVAMRALLLDLLKARPQSQASEQARRLLLLLACERGQFDQALQAADEILRAGEKGEFAEQARWLTALAYFAKSDFAKARMALEAYLNTYAGSEQEPAACYWLGRTLLELSAQPEAARYFQKAASRYSNSYYGFKSQQALQTLLSAGKIQAPPPDDSAYMETLCPGSAKLKAEPLDPLSRLASKRATALAAFELGELAERELGLEIARRPSPELNLQYARLATALGKHMAAVGAIWKVFGACLQRGAPAELASLREIAYPRKYAEVVRANLAGSDIDSGIIFGLIRQESFFEENAVSAAGAVGLMQMMPATAKVLARDLGETRFTAEDLREPGLNIRFGTAYFKQKLRKFGSLAYTLCSYNAGEKKLKVWIDNLSGLDPDLFVEFIPYSETRDYVRRILSNQLMYDKLYSGQS